MQEFLKLCFDLSYYLAITGFYGVLFHGDPLFLPAVFILPGLSLLDGLWSSRKGPSKLLRGLLPFLAAGAILLLGPTRAQFLRFLPFLVYYCSCLHSGRVSENEDSWLQSSRFVWISTALLLFPVLVIGELWRPAMEAAAPWLCLLLFSGLIRGRLLRLHSPDKRAEWKLLCLFGAACVFAALIRLPVLLQKLGLFLWRFLLLPLIELLFLIIGYISFAAYWLFNLILGLGEDGPLLPPASKIEAAKEALELEENAQALQENPVFKIIILVLCLAALAYALYRVFRRLIGVKEAHSEETEEAAGRVLSAPKQPKTFGRIRPKDPRLAVRFTFDKFLRECKARGVQIRPNMTAEMMLAAARDAFPGADPEELRQIWLPARYSSGEITEKDAKAAAALYKKLKKAKK